VCAEVKVALGEGKKGPGRKMEFCSFVGCGASGIARNSQRVQEAEIKYP
jgi:hypothetical protein